MSSPALIVETKYGKLQGSQEGPVQVWKGVPYAAPPVGPLRFRPPQPLQPWEGVRDATAFGPIAPQRPMLMERLLGRAKVPYGEDCLYLNIWSPAADDKQRPVLFWIHGGAFLTGSGSTPWYNGTSFATAGDVVVVTINYRLGVFGFLHLAEWGGEEYATSGNCGMLDQIAALEWVRDNIAAFGGDPNRITIFGESAGAMSVGTLLAMPAAQGLFQQAILQSGSAYNVRSRETAGQASQKIVEALGLEQANPLPALLELPMEQLLDGGMEAMKRAGGRLGLFGPVVDGVAVPEPPAKAIAAGSAKNITTLIGTTLEEMKLFTMFDPTWTTLDEAGIKQRCAQQVGEKIWSQVEGYYADQPASTPLEKWTRLLTDTTFWMPAVRLAEAQVKQNAPTWMYRFDYRSTALEGKLGAGHALEIPFVWNNLDKGGANLFTGDSPDRQPLADKIHAAWIAFAHTGNPNTATLPDCPAYNLEQRATLIFDTECRVENDPQAGARRAWEGLL